MRLPLWVRAACCFWTPCFVVFAFLQLNDPDPVQWTAIYLAAAVCCAFALRARLNFRAPLLVLAIALVWALTIVPRVVGHKSFFDNMALGEGMRDPVTEESRELGGLLIVSAGMGGLPAPWRRGGRWFRAQRGVQGKSQRHLR